MNRLLRKFLSIRLAALLLALWAAAPGPATALMLGFENITDNIAGDAAIGEAQLGLEVTETGDGGVSFEFSNIGPDQSTITHIYFDEGVTLNAATLTIEGDAGVNFSPDDRAGNLPGGNSLDPKFDTVLSVGADAPSPQNGINPGESVTLTFASLDFQMIIDAFNAGLFLVGIHVQNFATGGSESFVATAGDTPPVPRINEPGSLLIFGAGIIGVAVLRRRKSQGPRLHNT